MEPKAASAQPLRRVGYRRSRLRPLGLAVLALAALAALAAISGLYLGGTKTVTVVEDGGLPRSLVTRARTVGDVLAEAGIVLREGDEVTPGLESPLERDAHIAIVRADVVTVRVDGDERQVAIARGTVRDALARAGVVMGALDRVVPGRDTPLEDGMSIEVIRVVQEVVEEREPIPFRTIRWEEPQLPRGAQRVVREGREGTLVKRVRYTYENGQLVHRQELGHEVVEEPVNRIIGIGTREAPNVLRTASGTYRYIDVLEMEATAYYPGPESTGIWADGYTFTGLLAGKGVVAVDPKVIPLGTRLYVEGYGEAIAADIGGAIKGYRIDLGFDTYQEAIEYGRKKGVKVYILADN